MSERMSAREILAMKGREKIPVLTCYDWAIARLLDAAGVPLLLVGDSLGNVVLGYETTVPVRIEQMIHHAAAVMRARPRALVVVDMPFLSYQISPERALESAGRIVQESGADAVKLEGGRRSAEAARRMVEAGIPVMGHLGLTPQSVLQLGGYPVQGRGAEGDLLLEEAHLLEEAGCFSLVLEKVPATLARRVTKELRIPTIGIGAGSGCDGQVLVLYDLLGLVPEFRPRFVKRFAELGEAIRQAADAYCREVRSGEFPGPEHEYREAEPPSKAGTGAQAKAAPPHPPSPMRSGPR